MKLQLINGHFSPQDALEILTKMTQVKINYHERQIKAADREEDIKYRENRIKQLQRNLQHVRDALTKSDQSGVSMTADIILSVN